MLFCSSTEDNAWTSTPGRTVLGVFFLQAAVNQVRRRTLKPPAPCSRLESGRPARPGKALSIAPCHAPPCPPHPTPHAPPRTPPPQVSYRLNLGYPVIENLACLFAFMLLSSYCLWRNLRAIQHTWAEALLAPKGAKLRWGRPALAGLGSRRHRGQAWRRSRHP
jgi:hypothetical protein